MGLKFRHGNLSENVHLEGKGDGISIKLILNNIVVVPEQNMTWEIIRHWISVPLMKH
jgi:hypothetical protein